MRLSIQGRVSRAEAAAVLVAADSAAAADGVAPLSEAVRLDLLAGGGHLPGPGATATTANLMLRQGHSLAGFAHLGRPDTAGTRTGELFVHPAYRRRGSGHALVRAIGTGAGSAVLHVWAHGDLPAAAGLARSAGFHRVRELWFMERPLTSDLGEPQLPEGVTLGTFVPGADEDAWVALNAKAFASHPEQGRWTRDDLTRRETEPWFDPSGFLVARREGSMAGFHWTKVHPAHPRSTQASGQTGEVYVVGVDPAEQGRGLGRTLTLAGLRHLRGRGIGHVVLYADADNTSAVRLYESLGFAHTSTDVVYERPGASRSD